MVARQEQHAMCEKSEATSGRTSVAPELRRAFSGQLLDVAFADKGQVEFFAAVGRSKAPFNGVKDWPYLNTVVQTRSTAMLAEEGEDAWRANGGIYGADGRPTFAQRSGFATAFVQAIASKSGGFIWTDARDVGWAVSLLAADGGGTHSGLAVSWCGGGRILDPVARDEYRRVVESQIAETAANETETRRRLQRIAERMWLYERGEQMLWLIHAAVLAQRKSVVLLPDIMLGEAVWGADHSAWPDNWRNTIGDVLWSLSQLFAATLCLGSSGWEPRFESRSVAVTHVEHLEHARKQRGFCRHWCPLWNQPIRHGHFLLQVGCGFLGVLEQFVVSEDQTGTRQFDFRRVPRGDAGKAIKAARKHGMIVPVHLPSAVFGTSRWSGLTRTQRGIIQGIVREVTRDQSDAGSKRPDRAEVFVGNRVPAPKGNGDVACELLDRTGRYVAFNGNGLRRGRGYLFFGRKGTGWLAKCGLGNYRDLGKRDSRLAVRTFLRDLTVVARMMSLTVVAIHPRTGQWIGLDRLAQMAALHDGPKQLADLHLRVYGPEDYLERCRQALAELGGFISIPGGTRTSPPTDAPVLGNANLDLRLRMQQAGVTQRQLAQHLGVTEPFVSGVLKGTKKWPGEMRQRAERFVEDDGDAHYDSEAGVALPLVKLVTTGDPGFTGKSQSAIKTSPESHNREVGRELYARAL